MRTLARFIAGKGATRRNAGGDCEKGRGGGAKAFVDLLGDE